MEIGLADDKTLTAFNGDDVVGTKVIDGVGSFLFMLAQAIRMDGDVVLAHQNPNYAGSGFFDMPTDAYQHVRCGVAMQEGLSPRDKHIKRYRGEDGVFALPSKAAPVDSLRVLVYEIDKYLSDPQVRENSSHCESLLAEDTTHVIVAVHAGPGSLSSHRLARNIAGDNQNFIPKSRIGISSEELLHGAEDLRHDAFLLHAIIAEANATVEYEKKYIVVADPTNYDN